MQTIYYDGGLNSLVAFGAMMGFIVGIVSIVIAIILKDFIMMAIRPIASRIPDTVLGGYVELRAWNKWGPAVIFAPWAIKSLIRSQDVLDLIITVTLLLITAHSVIRAFYRRRIDDHSIAIPTITPIPI